MEGDVVGIFNKVSDWGTENQNPGFPNKEYISYHSVSHNIEHSTWDC